MDVFDNQTTTACMVGSGYGCSTDLAPSALIIPPLLYRLSLDFSTGYPTNLPPIDYSINDYPHTTQTVPTTAIDVTHAAFVSVDDPDRESMIPQLVP